MTDKTTPNNLASFCWSIADLLRGDFRQSQYGRIILQYSNVPTFGFYSSLEKIR